MKTTRLILEKLSKYGWATALVVLGSIALGFTWSNSDDMFARIRLFDRIAFMVDQNYVEAVDRAGLIKAGIDGMLSKLDKYTRYLEGGDYLQLQQATDGRLEGIGVYLEYHRDTLTVISVLEGTSGYEAGIKPGDRVLMIDTVSTIGLEMKDVRLLLNGEKGSPVELLLRRPGDGDFRITARRANVDIESIPYYDMVSDEIGYIRLARFSEKCSSKMKNAIISLQKKGMKALILDLRENPGGLLAEAIDVAGLFLPENSVIVQTRGRDGMLVATYAAYGDPVFLSGELAVLVNEQTASAAEIVAGAIQDHDRGVIIGRSSYGKGLVQQVLMVSDESALKITTSRYQLPSGRCLQKPDWSTSALTVKADHDYSPDSMYFTRNNRPVFGGDGITPDIVIDDNPQSEYVDALKRESCFFDFATAYIKANDIGPDFSINSKIMSEFGIFVRDRNIKIEEKDRQAYDVLRNNLSASDSETDTALAVLDRRMQAREQSYFDSNYRAVAEALEEAILVQRFGEKKLYERWLSEQPQIAAAVELLSNNKRYSSIFTQR